MILKWIYGNQSWIWSIKKSTWLSSIDKYSWPSKTKMSWSNGYKAQSRPWWSTSPVEKSFIRLMSCSCCWSSSRLYYNIRWSKLSKIGVLLILMGFPEIVCELMQTRIWPQSHPSSHKMKKIKMRFKLKMHLFRHLILQIGKTLPWSPIRKKVHLEITKYATYK